MATGEGGIRPETNAGSTSKRVRAANEAHERRAQWIVMEWANNPSATPGRMQEAVRQRFHCGIEASKRAHARAVEIRNESFKGYDLAWYSERLNDIAERAMADKKWYAAIQAYKVMATISGVSVERPPQVNVAIASPGAVIGGDLAMMPDEELDKLAGWHESVLRRMEDRQLTGGARIIDVEPTNGHKK